MRRIFLLRLLGPVVLLMTYTAPLVHAAEVTVAVAANLEPVIEQLRDAFEKQSTERLKIVTGSSGKLAAQIINGAPFHVFLCADTDYPAALVKEGLTAGPLKVYARGILVIWSAGNMDLSQWPALLSSPSLHKIAVANPQTAPYGRQAVNALKFYKIYETVGSKLVYGESIGQVNEFIASQAAEVGITSKSTVLSPALRGRGSWIEIERGAYEPIAQAAVILKYGQMDNPLGAQRFFDFLFSPEASRIFHDQGYELP